MRGRHFTRLAYSKGTRIGPPHFHCFRTQTNISIIAISISVLKSTYPNLL